MNLKNHSIHDNFIDEKTCVELIEYRDSLKYDDNYYNKLDDIQQKILSAISTDFNENMHIDNSIVRRFDTMVQKNGMKWHIDNLNYDGKELSQRTFTASIVLNKNFVGGIFKFKVDGDVTKISPKVGQLVLIKSGLWHGVEDIIVGKRYVFLLWTCSEYNGDVRETHMSFSNNHEEF